MVQLVADTLKLASLPQHLSTLFACTTMLSVSKLINIKVKRTNSYSHERNTRTQKNMVNLKPILEYEAIPQICVYVWLKLI